MYLSRVEINPYRRETMRALGSPQIIHAAVMASFNTLETTREDRILWRIDTVGPSTYILIQSSSVPDMRHIVDQFGRPDTGEKGEVARYDEFLSSLKQDEILRFRLTANPVHSIKVNGSESRGKVMAHVTIDQQKKWLSDRADKLGFSIAEKDGDLLFDVVNRKQYRFRREGKIVTLSTATFEGVLRVEDKEKFLETLRNGIGRGKAYGCGLLTVMRK